MWRAFYFGMRAGLQTTPANFERGNQAGPVPGAAEFAILRESVRRALPGASPAPLPSVAGIDWPLLLWLGRAQRALLFLRELILALEPAQRPPEVLAQLGQLHEANQFRALERSRELCLLQDVLAQAGVAAVETSGWVFGQRHYPNPALRHVGATTAFLVDPAERERAERALAAVGYTFGADPLRLVASRRSQISLLTNLDETEAAAGIPFASIRERAELLAIGGRTLAVLAARDWFFRLGSETARAEEASLVPSFDLALLVLRQPALDWAELLDEARRTGHEARVLLGLSLSREVLGISLPAPVQARLEAEPVIAEQAQRRAGAMARPMETPARQTRALPQPDPAKELAYIGRFAPTPIPVVLAMLRFAGVGPDDVVCDLGCGDGRVVIAAAKHFGARGVGIDIDPQRIAAAQKGAAAAGVADRVTLTCADVLQTPITGATVVCLYLQGFAYPVLREKLERELPRGTRLVSHNFVFPGWPPEKTEIVRSDRLAAAHIYLWRIGGD